MTEIHTVGVLGAGTMGAGIVQVAAEAGLGVLVHDPLDGATETCGFNSSSTRSTEVLPSAGFSTATR